MLTDKQIDRFLSKVKRGENYGDCWEWIGATRDGYGAFNVNGKTVGAHRLGYELINGPIPKGMYVLHSCDNRKCSNPSHLSVGTQQDNMLDKVRKSRQAKGSDNGSSKLTEKQVKEIYSAVGSQQEIADQFGIGLAQVYRIKNKKRWKHLWN